VSDFVFGPLAYAYTALVVAGCVAALLYWIVTRD
jgi:hypothetical protein